MPTFRSGKTSAASVQGTTLANTDWSIKYNGQDLDTTNFESDGYEEGLTGILSASWTLKGSWDSGSDPTSDPPGLYPRDDGVDMTLTPSTLGGRTYSLSSWRCMDTDISTNVRGVVQYNSSGKNQGTFSF